MTVSTDPAALVSEIHAWLQAFLEEGETVETRPGA
jgi:hypothetical protein